jgi:hypothetical protein
MNTYERTHERLQRFYGDWNRAIDAVRTVCAGLGLPKEAWMVSSEGRERVEAYEPVLERAERLHAERGGMAVDFTENSGGVFK